MSDTSSEISDEGYKTSDNSRLNGTDKSGIPKDGEITNSKGHHSRRASMDRARSLSTDEGIFCKMFARFLFVQLT